MFTPEDDIHQDCRQLIDRLKELQTNSEEAVSSAAGMERKLLEVRAALARRRRAWKNGRKDPACE